MNFEAMLFHIVTDKIFERQKILHCLAVKIAYRRKLHVILWQTKLFC